MLFEGTMIEITAFREITQSWKEKRNKEKTTKESSRNVIKQSVMKMLEEKYDLYWEKSTEKRSKIVKSEAKIIK